MQWTQYTVDTIHSGCSRIVVYGGGDNVHCVLCPLHPLVWPFCTKDNVPITIYHYSTVSTAYCVHWFDLFAPKTMSPSWYTTIPLHTASTVSTGLTFLHQRQCHHHHIPLFHCVLCLLVWPLCTKDNFPTTTYHYSTVYCVHWFDLFAPKTMSPPPYTTIPLRSAYCVLWFDFLAPKTMSPPPYTTIPLRTAYCVLCLLHGVDLFALKVMVQTTHIR